MALEQYFQLDNGKISYTREQGSDFAKAVAGDFNPIHDVDAKRFCVPGDLLFTTLLLQSGLRQQMSFRFEGMVTEGVELEFPALEQAEVSVSSGDKRFLSVQSAGELSQDQTLVESFARAYVAFSGQTFPHILVPLWQSKDIMVNAVRPMVIYESMHIDLDRLDIKDLSLRAAEASLDVDGKRGKATLNFDFYDGDEKVGAGYKTMLLSGLRAYDQAAIDELVAFYEARKSAY